MAKKKWFSLLALICIATALLMYLAVAKENGLHDFFWIPLILAATFLFAATRIK
ncbi:MAG: hypothetical protein IPP96_03770 [Chitinophagaceae bacterium]|nr:hypothetical protein [Chitinophagaceae bacterium]